MVTRSHRCDEHPKLWLDVYLSDQTHVLLPAKAACPDPRGQGALVW